MVAYVRVSGKYLVGIDPRSEICPWQKGILLYLNGIGYFPDEAPNPYICKHPFIEFEGVTLRTNPKQDGSYYGYRTGIEHMQIPIRSTIGTDIMTVHGSTRLCVEDRLHAFATDASIRSLTIVTLSSDRCNIPPGRIILSKKGDDLEVYSSGLLTQRELIRRHERNRIHATSIALQA